MKLTKIVMAAVAVTVIVIAALFGTMAFIIFDLMSYTATGSETLNPAGSAGKALVVYDPGLSGNAKSTAGCIADELKSKRYMVDLSGIRGRAAANTSGYDVIVVGGPVYAGNISSSIQSYMNSLEPSGNVCIGMFATGSVKEKMNDTVSLRKEIVPLPDDSPIRVKAIVKLVPEDDTGLKCAGFVNELLQ